MKLRLRILVLALIPLLLTLGLLAVVMLRQQQDLAHRQHELMAQAMLEARQAELKNYVDLALSTLQPLHERMAEGRREASSVASSKASADMPRPRPVSSGAVPAANRAAGDETASSTSRRASDTAPLPAPAPAPAPGAAVPAQALPAPAAHSSLASRPGPQAISRAEALRLLGQLDYGPDGYFFVYDLQGRVLMHSRQPELIGRSLIDLQDSQGRFPIRDLLAKAMGWASEGLFHS
jgi:signal transduction histidine kinase